MSYRVTGIALKTASLLAVVAGAAALSGCSSMGGLGLDHTSTGSIGGSVTASASQPMPKPIASTRVAEGPFIPPADIGDGSGVYVTGPATLASAQGSVTSQDLPLLSSSAANGSTKMMSAVQPMSPDPVTPKVASIAAAPTSTLALATMPAGTPLVSVPKDAYVHVILSGESLYTIARHYNVTAQAIIQANGFSAPDKIYVGQKLVIPGRADLLAKLDAASPAIAQPMVPAVVATAAPAPASTQAMALAAAPAPLAAPVPQTQQMAAVAPVIPATKKPVVVASIDPKMQVAPMPKVVPQPQPQVAAQPAPAPAAAPAAQPLQQPAVEPVLAGKFRWPVSGPVITDFANSKNTGIDIGAPEGAAVRAVENGQVIYAGSGVAGYGNLILIRHPNGFVSAYAHLEDMNVAKGTVVNRGDNIGTVGKTGGLAKAELHFELRKGATPVDPVPLLAS